MEETKKKIMEDTNPSVSIFSEKDVNKVIKKLRIPFDNKVYAIPYAGNLFEDRARLLLKALRKKIKKIDVSGGGNGRRLKEQLLELLK